MSTFKPSYDEVVMSARVCPLPMRRERSDLCASSVMRLARHTERSPGPTCTMSTAVKPLQTAIPKRQPLRPPDTACDPKMISNCIEELRRRRLQLTNERSPEQPSQFTSPKISLRVPRSGLGTMGVDWGVPMLQNEVMKVVWGNLDEEGIRCTELTEKTGIREVLV
ncbi:hypothetical protein OSTOST_11911, partial [Ostertagia ostertagi]